MDNLQWMRDNYSSIESLQFEIGEWADRTFPRSPEERAIGILNHLKREVVELMQAEQMTRLTFINEGEVPPPPMTIDERFATMHKALREEAADVTMLILNYAHGIPYDLVNYGWSQDEEWPETSDLNFVQTSVDIMIRCENSCVPKMMWMKICPISYLWRCMVLFANKYEFNLLEEVKKKFEINQKRTWGPLDAEGVSSHVKVSDCHGSVVIDESSEFTKDHVDFLRNKSIAA